MTSRLSWEIDYLKNDLSFCQYQTVKRSFFVLTCADRLLVSLISMFRSEFHDAVFPSVTASFAYNTFNIIGVAIDETIINKITDVKYTGVSSPAESPFCDTISATSPLVIIPTPIFKESKLLNLHSRAVIPQPIILDTKPTSTKY